MNWKSILRQKFSEEDYSSSLNLLIDNICNKVDVGLSYLNLIYLYIYVIVETDRSKEEAEKYQKELLVIWGKIPQQLKDEPEFMFFTAYIICAYGEYWLGLKEKDMKNMFLKATLSDPANLLYQWGYSPYTEDVDEKKRCEYAASLLNNADYVKSISDLCLVGDDLLELLRYER